VDLYLCHWPFAFVPGDGLYCIEFCSQFHLVLTPKDSEGNILYDKVPVAVTWKAIESLYKDGLAKNIGAYFFLFILTFHYIQV
jgi:diketogulonate reductase-like aldo/keto reductase